MDVDIPQQIVVAAIGNWYVDLVGKSAGTGEITAGDRLYIVVLRVLNCRNNFLVDSGGAKNAPPVEFGLPE